MKREAEKDALFSSLPPPCLKAVKSLLTHWDGLTRFLDHPELPLDNNASERALPHAVTSRKNFRGTGAPWSASLAAWIYTLFATWSLHGLNIHTALADYLSACAKLGKAPDDLSPWLPWSMGPDRKAFLSRPRPPRHQLTPPIPPVMPPRRSLPLEERFFGALRPTSRKTSLRIDAPSTRSIKTLQGPCLSS